MAALFAGDVLSSPKVDSFLSPFITKRKVDYKLEFELSKEQKDLQEKCCQDNKEVYVNAVCGSGKTEITYEVIKKFLMEGKRVGIAIPRKAIVHELYLRLKKVFKNVVIKEVYGGHNKDKDGEIVIFTTHQAYLFYKSFCLLIVDEYDAFPLKGDECLMNMTKLTSIEKSIYLSATFRKSDLENKYSLELNKRYHNHKMDTPNIIISIYSILLLKLTSQVQQYYKDNKKLLVYFPKIENIKKYSKFLDIFGIKHLVIYASNQLELNKLKSLDSFICLTSIILERGITIKDVNVIVFNANHSVFKYETLIQICGRVGRHYLYPQGEITFYATKNDKKFDDVISRINYANESLSDL